MADEIRVDYEVMDEVGKKFNEQAEVVEQMLRKIRARMEPLEDGKWQGKTARAFFGEMNNSVLPAWQRLHQALQGGAAKVKEVSDTMHQAEQDAMSMFKIR